MGASAKAAFIIAGAWATGAKVKDTETRAEVVGRVEAPPLYKLDYSMTIKWFLKYSRQPTILMGVLVGG